MIDTFDVSVRLAGLLLLNDSQLAIEDIEALPFVSSRHEADAIAQRLVKCFSSSHNKIELLQDPQGSRVRLMLIRGGRPGVVGATEDQSTRT